MLDNGWRTNPDGGGFAYINEDGDIVAYKTMNKDDFIDEYQRAHAKYGATSSFLVHMRIATHGKVKIETAHPFKVPMRGEGETYMIHNGIISDVDHLTNDDTSDTMAFIEHVLPNFVDSWLDDELIVDMISDWIGWSKLAFLTTSPELEYEMYIVNDQMGKWDDNYGWFSNQSCHSSPRVVSYVTNHDAWDTWSPPKEWDVTRMYPAKDMREASATEWHKMSIEAIGKGAACINCMGKEQCVCADACAECMEMYWECDCSGSFYSIQDLMEDADADGWTTPVPKNTPDDNTAGVIDLADWIRETADDDEEEVSDRDLGTVIFLDGDGVRKYINKYTGEIIEVDEDKAGV